jgi:hypothetical protein
LIGSIGLSFIFRLS